LAAPDIDLERLFARHDVNRPVDVAQSVPAAEHVTSAKATSIETVVLSDGTQITFGTISLPFRLETL
jgi:hypothetical protein